MSDSIEIAKALISSVFIELDVAIITANRNSDECSVCAIEGMKNRLAMAVRELECFKNSPVESGDTAPTSNKSETFGSGLKEKGLGEDMERSSAPVAHS